MDIPHGTIPLSARSSPTCRLATSPSLRDLRQLHLRHRHHLLKPAVRACLCGLEPPTPASHTTPQHRPDLLHLTATLVSCPPLRLLWSSRLHPWRSPSAGTLAILAALLSTNRAVAVRRPACAARGMRLAHTIVIAGCLVGTLRRLGTCPAQSVRSFVPSVASPPATVHVHLAGSITCRR